MKLQKYFFSFALLFLFSFSIAAQTVPDTDDVVGWTDINFIIPLKKRNENGKRVDQWIWNVGAVHRWGRDVKRQISTRATTSINYRFNKYFSAGVGYLYNSFRPTEARRQYEHRVMYYLNSEKKWTNVTFRNRSMVTHLMRHSRPDTVLYRNRSQLNFPIMKEKKEVVTPFVATEPFYDFKLKKWFRNDFFAGISKQFTPKFGMDFFYIRQGNNSSAIRTTNGLGVSMRVRIDKVK